MTPDYKDDLPLKVERRRNAKNDMARLINLNFEILVEVKRNNELLMDLIGVPPVPKKVQLPDSVPSFLK
jgi:hypothetical protein